MTTKSWKRLLWAVSIVSNGEGGCRLINDDTYLRARADMRDFHLKLHQMVKTIDFSNDGTVCHLSINVFMNSDPDVIPSCPWHNRQQP